MTKIIGIGNALTDVLLHIKDETLLNALQLPKGGMTLIGESQLTALHESIAHLPHERATGGSASNTIHALASLGDEVGFIGSVGDDETGRFFCQQALSRGVDVHIDTYPDKASGIATTFITPDGERTFATYLGAAACLESSRIVSCLQPGILYVEGYLVQDHDLIEQVLRAAKEVEMQVCYDLASWNIVANDREFIRHLVKEYVDIVFANEEEAAAFSGQSDSEEALRLMGEMTTVAIVKVGKQGAYGYHQGTKCFAPSTPRKAVDTTAAGDFFAAGFLHGWIHGEPLPRCLHFGNSIAGEVIQVMGTQVPAERLRVAITS
ncbi:MAG: adenosine kinase [Bacteroidaceae bacterium]|nr:adenosine kinase [Bacteroidaceae bacterium]